MDGNDLLGTPFHVDVVVDQKILESLLAKVILVLQIDAAVDLLVERNNLGTELLVASKSED